MIQTPFEATGNLTSVEDGDLFLHTLAADTSVSVEQAGTGVKGDPLWTATVGTGRARVAVISCMHGNEPASREAVYAFLRDMAYGATSATAQLAAEFSWTFFPTPNPSGIRSGQRQTSYDGDGGDLNRDFIAQEFPESRAIAGWLSSTQPALMLDLHEHLGTTTTEQIATGRQTDSRIHPGLRGLSDELNNAVASRVQSDGFTWSLYADSTTNGTARNESGKIYKSACVLGETDRTIALETRVGATYSMMDEVGLFWRDNASRFEGARLEAGGSPVAPENTGLFFSDGTPLASPTRPHTHPWSEVTGKPTAFAPTSHTHELGDVAGLAARLAALEYRSGRINITSNLDPAPVSGNLWIERRGGTVWLHMDALVLTATDMPERVYSNVIPTGYRIVAPAELPLAPRLADETRDVQTNIRTYNHVLAFYRVSGGAAVRGMVSWPTDQALPTT